MKKIVLGVGGSISAYKACEIASKLTQKKYLVYTIMTDASQKFITPLTFRTLTGNPVYSDLFSKNEEAEHVKLGKDADLIVIAPATASFISKLAGGICSDLLILTTISSKSPVLICPAMNETMYENKLIQANIKKLKKLGYIFLGPYRGWLSCGYKGKGRLAEPEEIVKKIEEILKK
jgi:phosphopantothenoylcysteine decarboxylase/phosphopantothenate--cysteine ligase